MPACPKCKNEVQYYGLTRNPKTDEKFTSYRCYKCKSTFVEARKNPQPPAAADGKIDGQRLPKPYGRAIKLFESFNMRPADKIITANISLPDNDKNPLVWLGKISEITYISDKEGKQNQQYVHETEPPYPDFFVTADGKTFIIAGGKMIVKDGWLYY